MSTRLARWLVFLLLRRIDHGALRVTERGRSHTFGPPDEALRVTVTIRDGAVWRSLLRGSTGFGESYVDGCWDADDLTALMRLAARNAHKLDHLRRRFAVFVRPVQLVRRSRANTPRRARRQIGAHYDLGNSLFSHMLDERMLYSCAIFDSPQTTLDDAQLAKLDAICRKLDLRPDDHLLEIGTGWGALAIHAAERYGCRVTTTTISREQHALATQRVREAKLDDRVTVLFRDYRELTGTYDKLVSIEMIEAVGWRGFGEFFSRCEALLEPDGLGLIQAITIDDRAFAVEKAGTSFITSYIFPGGCLPSVEVIGRCLRKHTTMRWLDLEDLTPHYVTTLRHWRERFVAAARELEAAGYDARFRRLWEFYLRYCEGGFAERRIGDVQILLGKPGYRAAGPATATSRREGGGFRAPAAGPYSRLRGPAPRA